MVKAPSCSTEGVKATPGVEVGGGVDGELVQEHLGDDAPTDVTQPDAASP